MLRLGLTGNLGSGKSTVAAMFATRGAHVLASDAIGREMMQPGQAVFAAIVEYFGVGVVTPGGELDRGRLARIAFAEGRADELNAIVHPAVIARQSELAAELFARHPDAVLVVESALIFETRFFGESPNAGSWRTRFDRILLVTSPQSEKIARFVRRQSASGNPSNERRLSLEADARQRLALQIPDAVKQPQCDFIIANDGSLQHLEAQVEFLWPALQQAARHGI